MANDFMKNANKVNIDGETVSFNVLSDKGDNVIEKVTETPKVEEKKVETVVEETPIVEETVGEEITEDEVVEDSEDESETNEDEE